MMDKIKIKLVTAFMRGMASKLITKYVEKHYGINIKLDLDDLDMEVVNGEATLKANVEVRLDETELKKIMKDIVFNQGS